jgi:hypothetical protein
MPRVSAASLAVVPVFTPALRPPEHLGAAEAAVFSDVVLAADRDHFRREDVELIALYCVHVITARNLMRKKRRTAEQERALRSTTALVVNLSSRLRLGPKSRDPSHRRRVGAGLENAGLQPWQLGEVDQADQMSGEERAPRREPVDWNERKATDGDGRR